MSANFELVSVIIPCYKQAHFLKEAIDSVLNQNYKNVEIIVVDDGSPDNTKEVALQYEAVRYFHQQNRGLAAARNAGLKRSTGRYVVFLDADDRLLPQALETHLAAFSAHPECAFVHGHHVPITADGTLIPFDRRPCPEKDHYFHLLQGCHIRTPGTAMFRRDVLISVGGFRVGTRALEATGDWEIYLRISRQFPILCHHRDVLEYRIHGDGMSSKASLMLQGALLTLKSQKQYVREDRRLGEAYDVGWKNAQEFYGEMVVNNVRRSLRNRDWRQGVSEFYILLRFYPQSIPYHVLKKIRCMIWRIPSDADALYVDPRLQQFKEDKRR